MALVVDIELTALTSPIVRAACRWVQTTATTAFPGSSKLVFYTTHAFYVYILTIIYIYIRMLYYFECFFFCLVIFNNRPLLGYEPALSWLFVSVGY